MNLDYADIAKATRANDTLRAEGIAPRLILYKPEVAGAFVIGHRIEIDEQEAERAKEILSRRGLLPSQG